MGYDRGGAQKMRGKLTMSWTLGTQIPVTDRGPLGVGLAMGMLSLPSEV